MRRLGILSVRILATAGLILISGALAHAQAERLPRGFEARDQIAGPDLSRLEAFCRANFAELTSEDPQTSAAAREALIDPLTRGTVSVAFRLAYGSAAESFLNELSRHTDPRLSAVAMRIAGGIATGQTLRILEAGAKDARPAVRFAAGEGYRTVLRGVFSGEAAALGSSQVRSMLRHVTEAIAAEQNPLVFEGLVRAFQPAEESQDAALVSQAMSQMMDAVARRTLDLRSTGGADVAWAVAMLRALDVAYKTMLAQQVQRGTVEREFAASAVKMAAQFIALVRDALSDGFEPDAQNPMRRLAGSAETLLLLADAAVNRTQARGERLQRAFDQAVAGQTARFDSVAAEYIGPEGVAAKPPYSVPAAELAPRR